MQQSPLKLDLRVSLNRSRSASLQLVVRNEGEHVVKLDRRLLTGVLIFRFQDAEGNNLATLPPPVPRPLEASDIIPLKPNEETAFSFNMLALLAEAAAAEARSVQCVYDSSSMLYPDGMDMWRGRMTSAVLPLDKVSPQ